MLLLLFIALALFTVIVSAGTGYITAALVIALLSLWSNGLLYRFRDERRRRLNLTQSMLRWAPLVSMTTLVASIVILVLALQV